MGKKLLRSKLPLQSWCVVASLKLDVNLLQDEEVEVEIVSPHFVDPEGERLRA